MSVFSLKSDFRFFFRMKKTGTKLFKYGQNMDTISIVLKDMLDSGQRLDNPSLNTVSKP